MINQVRQQEEKHCTGKVERENNEIKREKVICTVTGKSEKLLT